MVWGRADYMLEFDHRYTYLKLDLPLARCSELCLLAARRQAQWNLKLDLPLARGSELCLLVAQGKLHAFCWKGCHGRLDLTAICIPLHRICVIHGCNIKVHPLLLFLYVEGMIFE